MESQGAGASFSTNLSILASNGSMTKDIKEVKKKAVGGIPNEFKQNLSNVKVSSVPKLEQKSPIDALSTELSASQPEKYGGKANHKVYTCKHCDKTFTNPQVLGGHQNAHRHLKKLAKRKQNVDVTTLRYSPYNPHPALGYPTNYSHSYSSMVSIRTQMSFNKSSGNQMPFGLSNSCYQWPDIGSQHGHSEWLSPDVSIQNTINHSRMYNYQPKSSGLPLARMPMIDQGFTSRGGGFPASLIHNSSVSTAINDTGFVKPHVVGVNNHGMASTMPHVVGLNNRGMGSTTVAISNIAGNKAICNVSLQKEQATMLSSGSCLRIFGVSHNVAISDPGNGKTEMQETVLNASSPLRIFGVSYNVETGDTLNGASEIQGSCGGSPNAQVNTISNNNATGNGHALLTDDCSTHQNEQPNHHEELDLTLKL